MALTETTAGSPLLAALRREPTSHTPVWFMRQAGRYLPEYRAIRRHHGLLEIVARPKLAAEVTLQPVERFGVDAAILFADILLPLVPMGLRLAFAEGEGPVIDNPIRSAEDLDRLRRVDVETDLGSVLEAVRLSRQLLGGRVPLIGFAGAPFTLAAYAIDGGSSRHYLHTKRFMYHQPDAWHRFLGLLSELIADYLAAQVKAGAQVVQVFDSWAGLLAPIDYHRFVFPHTQSLFRKLSLLGVPTIHFGVGTATLLEELRDAGGDTIGLDWRVNLDEGWDRVGHSRGVQGNLDPTLLFAPLPELRRQIERILGQANGRPGHVFNLGHGILPETPIEAVQATVEIVHELTAGNSR